MMNKVELTFGQLNEICFNRSKFIELLELIEISKNISDNKSFYNVIEAIQNKLKNNILKRNLKEDETNKIKTKIMIENNAIIILVDAKQNRLLNDKIMNIESNLKIQASVLETQIILDLKLITNNIPYDEYKYIPELQTKVIEKTVYEFEPSGHMNYIAYWATNTIKQPNNKNQCYGIISSSKYDIDGIEYDYIESNIGILESENNELLPDKDIYAHLENSIKNNKNINSKYHNQRIGANLMKIDIEEYIKDKKIEKHFTNIINYEKPLKNLEKIYEPKFYNIMFNSELEGNTLFSILAESQNEDYKLGLLKYEQKEQ